MKTSTSDGLHESRNEPRMSAKPLETASFAGETEHHLFRLKSRTKSNDINARFDSSCKVLVIEDQFLGDESKCDFRPRGRKSCIGARQIPRHLDATDIATRWVARLSSWSGSSSPESHDEDFASQSICFRHERNLNRNDLEHARPSHLDNIA